MKILLSQAEAKELKQVMDQCASAEATVKRAQKDLILLTQSLQRSVRLILMGKNQPVKDANFVVDLVDQEMEIKWEEDGK